MKKVCTYCLVALLAMLCLPTNLAAQGWNYDFEMAKADGIGDRPNHYDVLLNGISWSMYAVRRSGSSSDFANGKVSARIYGSRMSMKEMPYLVMKEDKVGGLGVIEFSYRAYEEHATSQVAWCVQVSEDEGEHWETLGQPFTPTMDVERFHAKANVETGRVRIVRADYAVFDYAAAKGFDAAFNLDDISITDYEAGSPERPSIQTGEDRLNFGQVAKGETKTIKLSVAYKNLSADVALSLTGEGAKFFTLSKDKFAVSEPNGNADVDVTFAPQAVGPQQAVLQLQSGETIAEVQLTGTGIRKAGDFTYSGGSGTQDDPYLISNSGDIEDLSLAVDIETDYAGKYFKLTNDVDMEAVKAMKPIGNNFGTEGTALKAFSGTFDGDNHTISNLTMRFSGRFNLGVGLFGIVKNAKISNLTLTNCYFEADAIVASVASVLVGSEIINCHAGENVTVKARLKPYAGGIATSSFLTPSSIVACTSRANVDASDVAIGGILGMSSASGTTISRCINYGNVNTLNNFAGGIVGYVESGRLNIVDCLNAGEISAASCAGGLLGMALQGASIDIRNAYNIGRVTATDPAGALGPIFPAAALTDGLTLDVQNCYYDEALFSGVSSGTGCALSEMRSQTFADKLNDGRSEIVWKRFVGVNNELPVPCGEGEVIDGLMQQALAASYIQIEAGQVKAAAGVRLLGVCDVAGRQYAPASKLAAGTYIVTFMPTQGAQKPMSVKIIVPVR